MVQLTICAGVQLVLAAPFLLSFPLEYLIGAFNLGRVFLFEWTVNFRFLPEAVFVSRWLHAALLAGHLTALACCASYWWKYFSVYRKLHNIEVPNCEQLLGNTWPQKIPKRLINSLSPFSASSVHVQLYWRYVRPESPLSVLHLVLSHSPLPGLGHTILSQVQAPLIRLVFLKQML